MTADVPAETHALGVYGDRRPKDKVADLAYGRVVGLADAVSMQFDSQLPSAAGIALTWALLELEAYSELEPEHQVGYDLSGRDLSAVLKELRAQVAGLAQDSTELATTLRYLRAEAHVSEAAAAVAASSVRTRSVTPGPTPGQE